MGFEVICPLVTTFLLQFRYGLSNERFQVLHSYLFGDGLADVFPNHKYRAIEDEDCQSHSNKNEHVVSELIDVFQQMAVILHG